MTVDLDESQVIYEFYQIGNSVKVSAVDPVTTVEVAIVGPASATRLHLQRNALQKLKYVLNKRESG
jgi:hypothetical protein